MPQSPPEVHPAHVRAIFEKRVRQAGGSRRWAVQLYPEADGVRLGDRHVSVCGFVVPESELHSIPGVCIVEDHPGVVEPELRSLASVWLGSREGRDVYLVIDEVDEIFGYRGFYLEATA